MKTILILGALFFTALGSQSQNLVPNPSFEDGSCGWPVSWDYLSFSPDIFSQCQNTVPINTFGYQLAASGVSYAGLFTLAATASENYREAIGVQLTEPMSVGTKYFISFKTSLANCANCATNKLGVLFTTDSFSLSAPIVLPNRANLFSVNIISDTSIWREVKGNFIADSSYRFLSVGNFFENNLTSQQLLGNSCFGGDPGLCHAYYYVDDVCVSIDSSTCDLSSRIDYVADDLVQIYPNPTNNLLNIKISQPCESIFLLDDLGREVFKSHGITLELGIDVSEFQPGIYIVEIRGNDRVRTRKITILK